MSCCANNWNSFPKMCGPGSCCPRIWLPLEKRTKPSAICRPPSRCDPTTATRSTTPAALTACCSRKSEALDTLKKAIKAGYGNLNWASRDADLDCLHDDPEFRRLVGMEQPIDVSSSRDQSFAVAKPAPPSPSIRRPWTPHWYNPSFAGCRPPTPNGIRRHNTESALRQSAECAPSMSRSMMPLPR